MSNWNERYTKEASGIGHALHSLYYTIWPEGTQTMGNDLKDIMSATRGKNTSEIKDMVGDAKTQIQTLPGVAGEYVKEKINHTKNRLKGLTPEGLDPETGMLPHDALPNPAGSNDDNTDDTMDVY